ncbi:hypothetical protein [Rhodoflexus caldus]|nr:hypothetical protein [Rhodoflexus caldus]
MIEIQDEQWRWVGRLAMVLGIVTAIFSIMNYFEEKAYRRKMENKKIII